MILGNTTMQNREAQRAEIRRLIDKIQGMKSRDQMRITSDRDRKIIELFKRNQNQQGMER